ncbi:Uncharacterised protein [Mycobacteroides abscessus subsp. massiliense]|nr:Uncharacterised protein [Mycobacteroides abscessus subsp. massiliense]
MRASGKPFSNPNSGHWRIPGVLTLTAYLRDEGRYETPGYAPEPGDMVLYDKPSPKGHRPAAGRRPYLPQRNPIFLQCCRIRGLEDQRPVR